MLWVHHFGIFVKGSRRTVKNHRGIWIPFPHSDLGNETVMPTPQMQHSLPTLGLRKRNSDANHSVATFRAKLRLGKRNSNANPSDATFLAELSLVIGNKNYTNKGEAANSVVQCEYEIAPSSVSLYSNTCCGCR
jgi:hypothetical protein